MSGFPGWANCPRCGVYLPRNHTLTIQCDGVANPPPASPPRAPVATGWAVQRYGYVTVDLGPEATEEGAWILEIGSSHPLEIQEAKRRGARAFRVEVREIKE